MRNYRLIIFSILFAGCESKPNNLDCNDMNFIQASIKKQYNADQIEIKEKVIKEEIYFPEIRSIYITLFNATTKTLDFKSLPTDKYHRFENYEELENGLKKEGLEIYYLLKQNCILKDFDEVILVFGKRGEADPLLYDFIVHYKL